MADPLNGARNRSDLDDGREYVTITGAPRWVKMTAIAVLVAAILVIIVIALAGGGHGPGQHTMAPVAVERAAQVGLVA